MGRDGIIAENFNAVLLIITGEEQSLYDNCIQKAEFLLFKLLSSCIYKTEKIILIAATYLT